MCLLAEAVVKVRSKRSKYFGAGLLGTAVRLISFNENLARTETRCGGLTTPFNPADPVYTPATPTPQGADITAALLRGGDITITSE